MCYAPSSDAGFLRTLESWIYEKSEILTLFEHANSSGGKEFQLWHSFERLAAKIASLSSLTRITAFRQPQLPIRGIVDAQFIEICKQEAPDGEEHLIVDRQETREEYPHFSCSYYDHRAGVTHSELQEVLEAWRGRLVAVGRYPDWQCNSDVVVSAVVPDKNGSTSGGGY